jgi:endonuclease/exonuclease/phosphatase family metal-dependent hydrolase
MVRRYSFLYEVGLPALAIAFGMQSVRALLSFASYLLRESFEWGTVSVGLFGLAVFATSFLAAALYRFLGLRYMLLVTVGGLGLSRLAMQLWVGAIAVDFVFATSGVILFGLFLFTYLRYASIDQGVAYRGFICGLLLGICIDVAILGGNSTYDLVWESNIEITVVIVILTLFLWVFLWGLFSSSQLSIDHLDMSRKLGARSWRHTLPWIGIGPYLFLQMLLYQNLPRLVSLTEWNYPIAYAWMIFSQALVLIFFTLILRNEIRLRWPIVTIASVALILTLVFPDGKGEVAAFTVTVGQMASAVLIVTIIEAFVLRTGQGGFSKICLGHGFGMVMLLVFVFAYYASLDIDLGYNYSIVPPITGLILVGLSFIALTGSTIRRKISAIGWFPAQVALLLVSIPLVWALTWTTPDVQEGSGFPVRIVNYNLHNGFSVQGDLGLESLAKVIEEEKPDVIGLQEVSRGWLINGSVDMLTWLSQRLEMPYVYGPTTGPLWGNAMLSRYPITAWGNEKLPPKDLLLLRGYLWTQLDIGGGQQLRVITTHLHHIREDSGIRIKQTNALIDFLKGGTKTVIMGDFNARRNDNEIHMLRDAGLTDVVAMDGVISGLTYRSDNPQYQIDYMFLSQDLFAKDVVIPESQASDHRPIAATILLRE